jgi:hypothetical protein
MHTVLQAVIILSLFATYWCNENSDVDNFKEFPEERTPRPTYSSGKDVSRSSSYPALGDAVTQAPAHYDAGKAQKSYFVHYI